MDEADWLTRDRPTEMLSALWGPIGLRTPRYYPGKPGARIPTGRKLRLLGVGCTRLIPVLDAEPVLLRMVEAIERLVEAGIVLEPGKDCKEPWWTEPIKDIQHQWYHMSMEDPRRQLNSLALNLSWNRSNERVSIREVLRASGELGAPTDVLACLLRDLFANPFRPLPGIEPTWRAWNDGTIARIAQAVYEERRFEDLPILADALQEAGCSEEVILAHCRAGGRHWRGCWVIDRILERT